MASTNQAAVFIEKIAGFKTTDEIASGAIHPDEVALLHEEDGQLIRDLLDDLIKEARALSNNIV